MKTVFWEEIPFHTLTENNILEQKLIMLQRALGAGEGRGIHSPACLGAERHCNMLLYDAWIIQTFVLVNNIWEPEVFSMVNQELKSDVLCLLCNRLSCIFYANMGTTRSIHVNNEVRPSVFCSTWCRHKTFFKGNEVKPFQILCKVYKGVVYSWIQKNIL